MSNIISDDEEEELTIGNKRDKFARCSFVCFKQKTILNTSNECRRPASRHILARIFSRLFALVCTFTQLQRFQSISTQV
jgi:hypothetical protein